ncbi:CDP-glycerol glycerophosphotransferase family protein [Caldibacillus debilis]|uniref:CDP-glycerol glycerophosphotransferase family protein n=1 Tax=Caldibacillus debilis TaxID=301148 RepID=UPI00035FF858|nr:CDP-glycerol glycerophosphotransferase family protein [Caldibacillus debilis]
MKLIPKLISFEKDKENIFVKILLCNTDDINLSAKHFQSLVFSNCECQLFFPLHQMENNILVFLIDSIGIQKIIDSGLVWRLQLEINADDDLFLINVEKAAVEKYIDSIEINTMNDEKAVINVYYQNDKNMNIITTFIKNDINLIEVIDNFECKNDILTLGGKFIKAIDREYLLFAVPIYNKADNNIKSFKFIVNQDNFVISIPINQLLVSSEYLMMMGFAKNKRYYIANLPLNKFEKGHYFVYQNNAEAIFLKVQELDINDVFPIVKDINIKNNSIKITGIIYSSFENLDIKIEKGFLVHRKSGYSYNLENISYDNGEFSVCCNVDKEDYFNLSGVYDLELLLSRNDVKKTFKVFVDHPNSNLSSYIVTPIEFIFAKNKKITVRPYKTLENTVSFLVHTIDSIHEIEEVKKVSNGIRIICKIKFTNNYNLDSVKLSGEKRFYKIDKYIQKNDILEIFIGYEALLFFLNKNNNALLNLTIDYQIGDKNYSDFLISKNKTDYFSVSYPIYNFEEHNLQLHPFYNNKRYLLLKIGRNLTLNVDKIKYNKKYLVITLNSSTKLTTSKTDILFVNEENNSFEKATFKLVERENNNYDFAIKLKDIKNIKSGKYKIMIKVLSNSDIYPINIIDESILNQFAKINIKIPKSKIVINLYNNNKYLEFEITEDTISIPTFRDYLNNFVATIFSRIIKLFYKKEVWLIGENLGLIARDNGFAFFKYCFERQISEKYFYVAKKDNYDLEVLKKYKKRVINYDSLKHYLLYHLSNYLIVSHGIRDVIPSLFHSKMSKNEKDVIYLQHGIIAMKKLFFNSRSYNGKIKKFVVSSEQEKDILVNHMNFREDQVMITGLPRYDYLYPIKNENKEILLMPTWREWIIKSKDDFLNSIFYKTYLDLINNDELNALLEKNNITLNFLLHVEMLNYSQYFFSNSKFIKILNPNSVNISNLIKSSKMLITDYSSVAFDFAYLRKPIIFFHFDLEDYLKHRGSYVNLVEDLPGYSSNSIEEIIAVLKRYIDNDFSLETNMVFRSKKFFDYMDRRNSERIYNEIKKLR